MRILMSRTLRACAALSCMAALVSCGHEDTGPGFYSGTEVASGDDAPEAASADEVDPIVCDTPDGEAPTDVFCIGLYRDGDPQQVVDEVMPYRPGVVLWSDGADKQRYLLLPPNTRIDTSHMDVWKFPVGTKAFKEFRLDGSLVETRMLWKQADRNWIAVTYVWEDGERSATLNTDRTPRILDNGYEIPTGKDCGRCHHGGADKLLGVEAVALGLPDAEGNNLAALASRSLLSDPPSTVSITLPEDDSGHAAFALGYLHANCGMPCHSSRGLGDETNLHLRLRADNFWPTQNDVAHTDVYLNSIEKRPTTASVAQHFPEAVRIRPGDHQQSLLWLLSHLRGEYQMPPLVSHRIDEQGTQRLADWIDALEPPP